MLVDSHIHFGQFYKHYFSPQDISTLMHRCGVSYYLVSSTTTCEDNYSKVIDEFNSIIELDGSHVLPCLWLTETALTNKRIIEQLISSNIHWKCIKIHPALRVSEWLSTKEITKKIFKLSDSLNLPLLIHTGEDKICESYKYSHLISSFENVKIILAHGRPLNQAIEMALRFNNIYIDTAFMPVEDITLLVSNGLTDKVLWGTDFCLPQIYYPHLNLEKYYKKKLKNLQKSISVGEFEKITFLNSSNLFNI